MVFTLKFSKINTKNFIKIRPEMIGRTILLNKQKIVYHLKKLRVQKKIKEKQWQEIKANKNYKNIWGLANKRYKDYK
jgi:hypothetical protein